MQSYTDNTIKLHLTSILIDIIIFFENLLINYLATDTIAFNPNSKYSKQQQQGFFNGFHARVLYPI